MNPCPFLIGLFAALCGAGVVLMAVLPQKRIPQALALAGTLASLPLIGVSGWILMTGNAFALPLWAVPSLGTLLLQMDRLSALFALITGLVFLPVSIFCAGDLPRYLGRYSLRAFAVMYFALYASIVLILTADDVLLLLLAWEVMSILTYLLVNYEDEQSAHIRAGYVMLAFSEAGTLAAALGLLVLAIAAGSLDFASLKAAAPALGQGERWAVFLLTFFGFAVKAGLVPVNSWLPRAYAAAPSSFLPVLAGAMLNLGFYGILRFNVDLVPIPFPTPGLIVLIVGTVSAFLGILYATTDNDLKLMLAHSSIENAGIITVGLGAGLVFAACHLPACAAIAFVAAGYHMTNHSFYKTLLLLGAGAVEDRVGTRDLDKLGGLIRTMPWTALLFLVRRHVDRGIASFQRVRERMVDAPDSASQRGSVERWRKDHVCYMWGWFGADRGLSGNVLREGLRHGLPGDVPIRAGRAGQRSASIGSCADGAVVAAVPGPGNLADLRHSGARSCRGAAARVCRGRGPRPAVFFG